MFDTADILIHWQPVIGALGVQHGAVQIGAGKARVIPRRFHKGIEGICFALNILTV